MKYYSIVYTYKANTKLGEIITAFVRNRYHQAVLSREQAYSMPDTIRKEIARLCKDNPRLKPLCVCTSGYNDLGEIDSDYIQISVAPERIRNSRDIPFRLNILPVSIDYTSGAPTNQ